MRKSLAVLAAAVMLFAACGREGEPDQALDVTSDRRGATSEGNDAKAPDGPEATGEAKAQATDAPAAGDGDPDTTTAPAPVEKAPEGKTQPPKDGRYTYDYSGNATDPTTGRNESFDGESYTDISHSGDVYTLRSTNSEGAGRSTVKTRWTSTKVEFLEISIETPLGTYGCKFNPPLVITKFPVKPETYPTQTFNGEGNACDGKLDITIEKKESVKDATGRSLETWRAKVHTEVKSDTFSLTQDETRWASPDLGVEVRSTGTQNGEVKSGAFNRKFTGSTTSVLKQRP